MSRCLEMIAPAVWRASWQGAVLALVVCLLLWALGGRLPARWRYLLGGLVVLRLLVIITPATSWSAFNLAAAHRAADVQEMAFRDDLQHAGRLIGDVPQPGPKEEIARPLPILLTPVLAAPAAASPVPAAAPAQIAAKQAVPPGWRLPAPWICFSFVWLAGCAVVSVRLAAAGAVLRQRLRACRAVKDVAVLEMLRALCGQLGLNRLPELLVTAEPISPCIVGTWRCRIVLPESILAESPDTTLRHVLAHELAHRVRGDLWSNWLLLAVRILHWFNPAAWWTVRAMQAEREAACDELALAALGDVPRSDYASTLVALALHFSPPVVAPGMVGFFASKHRIAARVERLVRPQRAARWAGPLAAGLFCGIALAGLTDAMPPAPAKPAATKPAAKAPLVAPAVPPSASSAPAVGRLDPVEESIRGRCVDRIDRSPLEGVAVRLFRTAGPIAPPFEIARTVSRADGTYDFKVSPPPLHSEDWLDGVHYEVVATSANRPVGIGHVFGRNKDQVEIHIGRDKVTVTGTVVGSDGKPIADAEVAANPGFWRSIPGILSAKTEANGRFAIFGLDNIESPDGKLQKTRLIARHPDHAQGTAEVGRLPADIRITMPSGCRIKGVVTDKVTGGPAVGVQVAAERLDVYEFVWAETNAKGEFRLTVLEGRYNIWFSAKDRVGVALTNQDFLDGQRVDLPSLEVSGGGLIAGRVFNTATGEPVIVSDQGERIKLGMFGPSQPNGTVIRQTPLATVDETGRFTLRAPAGENFPYFVNTRGDRMAWDTKQQPAVVVKEGETTHYDMRITPPVPVEEKLAQARAVVAALPQDPTEKVERILEEFRKLNHTIDETELWCSLMRELVAIGPAAVPQLCDELDRTTENRMLRRLGFALRTIGDARAVPALIRAFPRTLLPASSDYGLIVGDADLAAFMRQHEGNAGTGQYFNFGRPEREIGGALKELTKQSEGEADLYGIGLSEDPRRQIMQRRLFEEVAKRWQTWWEAHCREFTDDVRYHAVKLETSKEALPPARSTFSPQARLGDSINGTMLFAPNPLKPNPWRLYDIETDLNPKWPGPAPADISQLDPQQISKWAADNGADLVCVPYKTAEGDETVALRALGMKVWEITPRDLRNLERSLRAGRLPEGRQVDEFLVHFDDEAKKFDPDAKGAFLFITREGTTGVIETHTSQNAIGAVENAPRKSRAIQFDVKTVIP